jgi:hypothetical protein
VQPACDGGLRILVVGDGSCLLFQSTRPFRLAAAIVDHSNFEGLSDSKNASGNRSRGVRLVVQSRSATAASVDRVVLRFSKLKLDRPTTMLAHFGKEEIVWQRVAWLTRRRVASSRIRVVAASQVTLDSPSAAHLRWRLTHPGGRGQKLFTCSVDQTFAAGSNIGRSQQF